MAVRIRRTKGETVALCAAETRPEKGDLYLDDEIDHALRLKYIEDYKSEGLIKEDFLTCHISHNPKDAD